MWQIQLSDLVIHSHLIQQFHLFKSFAISLVLSNYTVISRSTDPTYSTLSQIQLYYLILQSNLIQQFHIFNNVKFNCLILFTFSSLSTVALIQYCHKFSCISSLQSYLYIQFKHIQKFHKFTCLIQFHGLISFDSPTYYTVSQIH